MVDRFTRTLLVALAATTVPPAVLPALTVVVSVLGIVIDRGVAAALLTIAIATGAFVASMMHRALRVPTAAAERSPGTILLAALPLVLATCGILAWTWNRPVLDWDGLYYHVPAVQGWFARGGVHWIDTTPDLRFVNGYPMALEVMGYLSVHLLGHDRWLDAWNVLLWPVAAVGLATTARLWGAGRIATAFAATAFLLVPAWVLGSATAYVDAGFAAACSALVAATVWRLRRNDQMASALLWGCAAGLAASTKGTGLIVAALAAAPLVVDLLRRPARQRRSAVRALVVGLVVTVSIGGVWPIRAWIHTGNPIHPVQLNIGAKVVGEGVDAHVTADLSLPADLEDVPRAARPLMVWARPFERIDRGDQAAGLGPLWTLGALPALAFLAWSRRRRLEVIGPLVVVILGLSAQPGPWWARLSLWIAAVGIPAFAVLSGRLMATRLPTVRRAVGATAVGLVVVAAAVSTADAVRRVVAVPHAPNAVEHYFGDLASHPQWNSFASAPRVARSDFGRFGTLLGGALASPVGAREVIHVDDPREAPADVRWCVWDIAGAGPLPADLDGWHVSDRARDGFVLLYRDDLDDAPRPARR